MATKHEAVIGGGQLSKKQVGGKILPRGLGSVQSRHIVDLYPNRTLKFMALPAIPPSGYQKKLSRTGEVVTGAHNRPIR